ncbi:DUF6279 family lipoprotein [Glaciecola sp. SC05]|uniref:DUF6279 family lipoprotein n=1 Tax=Glaciecola sp. SC05 TaxID=1987355 RepID=UPI003529446A
MKKIIVLVAVFLLAGCSTKFAYKNLDWLVYWYVDDYIEMTNAQEQQFDQYIAQWQQWHVETELPKYQAHLEELANDIAQQNISVDRMGYHQEKARDHWERLREHISPGIADIAATMDEEQITYFFAALEKENVKDEEERLERLALSDDKRKDRWVDRNFDNLKNWLGRLSDEQKSYIENSYGNMQSNSENWVKYKRDYQQALRLQFAAPERDEVFKNEMTALLINPEQFRSEQMLATSAHNERATKEYLLTIFSLSTEKQRAHLIKEINDLRDDVVELSSRD